MRKLLISALLVCSVAPWAGTARAVSVTGGDTTLRLTVDANALGVDISAVGSATVAPGGNAFLLPITLGEVTPDFKIGSVEHEGSGLDLDFGGATLRMENLRFDLSERQVVADLSSGPLALSLEVFNLKHCVDVVTAEVPCTGASGSPNEFGLFLRPQAADFFENDVFGDRVFDDDDQIFLATVNHSSVPEPAGLAWLALALGGIGIGSHGRRRS